MNKQPCVCGALSKSTKYGHTALCPWQGEPQNIPEPKSWDEPTRKKFIGMKVTHPAYEGEVRTIVGTYEDIAEGVVLDKPISGVRSWNLADLRSAS